MFLLIKKRISSITSLKLRGWVALVAIETLIVVIGVYVAAVLSDVRDNARQRERFELITVALSHEIGPFVDQASGFVGDVRRDFDAWTADYEAGNRPVPFFQPATGFLARPHVTLWSAMLESGGLDLLPVELMTQIAEFYERTERMAERYNQIAEFARDQVLPHLDSGPEAFYAADASELRSMYAIHMQELEAVLIYTEQTVRLGEAIRANPLLAEN